MSGEKDSTGQAAPGGIAEVAGVKAAPQAQSSVMPSSAMMGEQRLHLIRNAGSKGASKGGQRPPGGPRPVRMLDRSLQERIGAALRESFVDIEQEPLPERLNKLIEALHQEEKRR
jgi:hypothetical protein